MMALKPAFGETPRSVSLRGVMTPWTAASRISTRSAVEMSVRMRRALRPAAKSLPKWSWIIAPRRLSINWKSSGLSRRTSRRKAGDTSSAWRSTHAEHEAERGREVDGVLGGNAGEFAVELAELGEDGGLDDLGLAVEVGVEGLLAHAEFGGEVIDRDAAEAVGEEVPPGAGDDALPGRLPRG